MAKPKTATLIMSGGMDSTTALWKLLDEDYFVDVLSFDYGQRHLRELQQVPILIERAQNDFEEQIEAYVINIASTCKLLFLGADSSQVNRNVEVPEGHYAEETMKKTVVPNRNMIMLSLATAYAISRNHDAVVYAAHQGDHAIYPDCRKDFIESLATTVSLCDWNPPKLIGIFDDIDKAGIAKLGEELGVPFDLTWSCYKGGDVFDQNLPDIHCGRCGTCVERKEAFRLAEVLDPTEYVDGLFKVEAYRG